ncbi:type II toxin-antitoxin system toxin TscT [Staphylococcus saprophyticus]|uniref:type II toxin-antitoxin system toxin TscT n=1 Tax=Staphylococcus saprophyticus TaxID=29385 RepID=UPI000E68DE70|nr:DUF1474 family protein [Staphylococcus saprophyticus]RIO40026.1 DUF1474 family protein [Staphylococcus saprophyticus]
MNFNQKDLISEFVVLKEKIDDVLTVHNWHGEDMFINKRLETKDEMMRYALGYNESRIQHEQTAELMLVYLKQFDDLIENFKALDIEKASSDESLATESDNA